MGVVVSRHCQTLLDVKADTVCCDLAVFVVHVNLASSDLIRHELILLKHAPHGGSALVAAAPSLDIGCLLLGLADLPLNGLLTDDQHLLILHHVVAAVLQLRFKVVFDLSLGLFSNVLLLEVERGRNLMR